MGAKTRLSRNILNFSAAIFLQVGLAFLRIISFSVYG